MNKDLYSLERIARGGDKMSIEFRMVLDSLRPFFEHKEPRDLSSLTRGANLSKIRKMRDHISAEQK